MMLRGLLLVLLVTHTDGAVTIYVAPDGSDAWSGRAEKRDGTNGPKATVGAALEAARAARREEADAKPVEILLRGGRHQLSDAITITPADSNITIAAYRDERPVLSGGAR